MKPLLLLLLSFSGAAFAIYGEDTRREFFEIKDGRVKQQASALAYQVERHYELRGWTFSRRWELVMRPYDAQNICSDQPYVNQLALFKNCTGILVSPKHLLTGGNCLTEHYCKNDLYYWMFDYNLKGEHFNVKRPRQNFYKCKKVIKRVYDPFREHSFALIELNKTVKGIKPAKLNLKGGLKAGEALKVLGHMRGLPLKLDDSVKVVEKYTKNFIVNSDLPGKYSVGSAIINANTGLIEGFFAGGTSGYEKGPLGCLQEETFTENEGYEYVYSLENIAKLLEKYGIQGEKYVSK